MTEAAKSIALGLEITAETAPSLTVDVLAFALRQGIRTIDLGDTYRHWGLMAQIGQTLKSALHRAELTRDAVEIRANAGRIPAIEGAPPLNDGTFAAVLAVRFVKPGVLSWDDMFRFDHSWAPELLGRQIRDMLERYDLDHLDVVLLEGADLLWNFFTEEEAQVRCGRAFSLLEDMIARGHLRGYGVRVEAPDFYTLPVDQVAACARAAADGRRHFRGLHVPMRPEKAARTVDTIAACHRLGIDVSSTIDTTHAEEVLSSAPAELDTMLLSRDIVGTSPRLLHLFGSLEGVQTVYAQPRTMTQLRDAAQILRQPVLPAEVTERFLSHLGRTEVAR